MQEVFTRFIEQFGYLAVMLLILIENIFPPIPSEVVLVFGGFLTRQTDMNVWGVILFSTIGSVLGAVLLYWLGYALQNAGLKKLFSGKFGRLLHLKTSDVDKAENFFIKYERKAVFFGRCIPVIRSLISIPAGISKMKFLPFILLTTIGSAIWNTILVWIGVFAGDAWQASLVYIGWYTKIVVIIGVVLCLILLLVLFIKKRKKKKNEQENPPPKDDDEAL